MACVATCRELPVTIKTLVALLILTAAQQAAALGISTMPGSSSPVSSVRLTLATETVGDRVDYTPNLPEGGFAEPRSQARYRANRLVASWTVSKDLTIESEISKLQITSLRDQFNLSGIRIRSQHVLPAANSNRQNILEFGFGTNFSGSINKNSYTSVGNTAITNIDLQRPSDLTFQGGFTHTRLLSNNRSLALFSTLGHIRSTNSGVTGDLTRGNCDYQFAFDSSGGEIIQPQQCGDIISLSRRYPSDETLESEFGLSLLKDTRYRALFFRIGGEYTARHGDWLASVGTYYQQYQRGDLDSRIVDNNLTAYPDNQAAWIALNHTTTRKLSFTARLEYNRHQFLDAAPVLYNRLTAHRFNNDVIFLSIKLHYLYF